MNIEILKEEYSRKMEKALRRGEFDLFDNLRRQYDRLLQTREQGGQREMQSPPEKNPSVGGHCRILRR